MRKLTGREAILGVVVASVAVFAIVTARPSDSAQLPPMFTSDELTQFEISQVADVTDQPTAVASSVGYAQAVAIASAHLGRPSTNVRVLHGSAKPIHALPERSVWIVMFAGGNLPALGPGSAASPRALRFAAVEIDDATGEILTWFMG